jgi:hypothetical protein
MTFWDLKLNQKFRSAGEAGYAYTITAIDTSPPRVYLKRDRDGQLAKMEGAKIVNAIINNRLVLI